MNVKDWAALVAALAAVVVALPAIPKSSARRYWLAGGVVLLLVAVALGVVAARSPAPDPNPSPKPSPSTSRSSPATAKQGVSKAIFLERAEKLCGDHRGFALTMPDRSSRPEDFGRWLRQITAANQTVLDALEAMDRPQADEDVLTDLFAQRQRANDLFVRSASAFEAGQSVTGEQFLNTATEVEEAYREAARTYGFSICIGSDTPGR